MNNKTIKILIAILAIVMAIPVLAVVLVIGLRSDGSNVTTFEYGADEITESSPSRGEALFGSAEIGQGSTIETSIDNLEGYDVVIIGKPNDIKSEIITVDGQRRLRIEVPKDHPSGLYVLQFELTEGSDVEIVDWLFEVTPR